jgi:hypothetical protein
MDYGTVGECQIQDKFQSQDRAQVFHERQMRDRLSDRMVELIRRQEMMFLATADANGNCDCSPRSGTRGLVLVLDNKTLAYPEFRGNGVYASLGNITENPHVGLVFVDFFDSTVGLHVNGSASIHGPGELPAALATHPDNEPLPLDIAVECWVVISVDEAYIHCSKHVPRLKKQDKLIQWGTDDLLAKSNDYFQSSPQPVAE